MRRKVDLKRKLARATSDLVQARLVNDWNDGRVSYLLGQVVTLTVVLDPEFDWKTAREATVEQIDRSATELRKRDPVRGQEAFCSTCGDVIVFNEFWRHKYEGLDGPGYMDANNQWQICGGKIKPKWDSVEVLLSGSENWPPREWSE